MVNNEIITFEGMAMRLAPGRQPSLSRDVSKISMMQASSRTIKKVPDAASLLLSAVVAGGWSIMGLATSQSISEGTVIRESRANIFVEDTKGVMGRLIFG